MDRYMCMNRLQMFSCMQAAGPSQSARNWLHNGHGKQSPVNHRMRSFVSCL